MAKLKWLLLFAVFLIYIRSSCTKSVALDATLSKAICKQMADFRAWKTVQPALEEADTVPGGLDGCGWVHWKQCPDGKDCSSFAHKRGKSCPSGGDKPRPRNGGSPSSAASRIFKMSLEIDGQEQCYLIDSSARLSQQEAAQKCRAQGGRLLAIESEKENVIVNAVLKASDQHKNLEFWTDAELTASGNTWKSSGQDFQYSDPSLTNSGHNCMGVKISKQKLHWIRTKCGSTHFVFCEINSSCEKVSDGGAPVGSARGGGGSGTGAPSSSPAPSSGSVGPSGTIKAGRVHISGSLSRSICGHMKTFRSSKKLQEPLNDKDKFASGDNECSWLHWQQQCESRGSCAPFLPKACNEVKIPSG